MNPVLHSFDNNDPKLEWDKPPPFPARNAPLDERLWAFAQLLRRIPGQLAIGGTVINASLINDLEDAAVALSQHATNCPTNPTTTYRARNTTTRSRLRWNYG